MGREALKNTWGLMAVDPGTTTGIAHVKNPITAGLKPQTAFQQAELCVYQISGTTDSEIQTAEQIADHWISLNRQWNRMDVPPSNRILTIEDFILRPGSHSSERSGLSPVRITSMLKGMLWYLESDLSFITHHQPSTAKARWNNERLKRADLWSVGLEHGRDATRHLALQYLFLPAHA